MTAPELTPAEAARVAAFDAAPYPPEVLVHRLVDALNLKLDSTEPCRVYSHGPDGWHCARTGPHQQHTNAAGDVTW